MWIEITEADVQTRLAGAELSAYRSAGKASGQPDPLPEIITAVVDEVRGYVAACSRNTLGIGTTIPAKLKASALSMIRYRLITRLPLTIGEERKQEYRDALDLMREVAACRFAVEEPADPDTTEEIATSLPSMGSRMLNFTRELQDGT
jgi:phage gp36-like protein